MIDQVTQDVSSNRVRVEALRVATVIDIPAATPFTGELRVHGR